MSLIYTQVLLKKKKKNLYPSSTERVEAARIPSQPTPCNTDIPLVCLLCFYYYYFFP